MEELNFLKEQNVDPGLVAQVRDFREKYPVSEKAAHRIVKPSIPFFGREILEMSIAALLKGENLLLTGPKATGKNVLAENLAYIFNRPSYNVSFHVNTNSGDLIGTDTFEDNQVKLRKGSIYRCAEYGGFGILDEINMAKNDAVSVLHATLDYRRSIDVPGYDKIDLHPAARFIGTMNYGYAGTKELNEALVSRYARPDGRISGIHFQTYVSPGQKRGGGAVCRRVPGSSAEGAEQRDIHKSPGSQRASGSHEDRGSGTFSKESRSDGRSEQDF